MSVTTQHKMFEFIIAVLWSDWRSACQRNEHLPAAASWSMHTTYWAAGSFSLEEAEVCTEAELMDSIQWHMNTQAGLMDIDLQAKRVEGGERHKNCPPWVKYEHIAEAQYDVIHYSTFAWQ